MWLFFIVFLMLVITLLLYIYWIRPLLTRLGWVRPIPPEYQNWMDRVYVFVRWSLTMVVGWITSLMSFATILTDKIAEWANLPDVQEMIKTVLGDYPKFVAGLILALGFLFMLTRLRKAPSIEGVVEAEKKEPSL